MGLGAMEVAKEVLEELNVSEKEMEVYFFLNKSGPIKAKTISNSLGINRVQLYRIIKGLQKKGMIESSFEKPARFQSISFSRILNRMIKEKKDKVSLLENYKEIAVSQIDKIGNNNVAISEKFLVLQGRKNIFAKARELIQEAKTTVIVVSSGFGIMQAFVAGLMEAGFSHPLRDKISWQFLTNSPTARDRVDLTIEMLKKAKEVKMKVESYIVDINPDLFPRFIIKDNEELVFFLHPNENATMNPKKESGFWTNNKVLVHAFLGYYQELRRKSACLRDEITESNTRDN